MAPKITLLGAILTIILTYRNLTNDSNTAMQTRVGKWDRYVGVRLRVRIIVPLIYRCPLAGFTGRAERPAIPSVSMG